ncbi:MAG: hypothetical protein RLZZ316_2536 [Bacteroidota bacterium]|jgi:hypothetical protein
MGINYLNYKMLPAKRWQFFYVTSKEYILNIVASHTFTAVPVAALQIKILRQIFKMPI